MVNPFSKLGDIGNIMKQAKEMQSKMQAAQEELARTHIVGEAGAGLVHITINGNGEALSVAIDDSVLEEDKKILQGLVAAAINDANYKRELKKKEIMQGVMTGMGLPADLDLLKGM
jgi:nucleoid-associated protein EbfC